MIFCINKHQVSYRLCTASILQKYNTIRNWHRAGKIVIGALHYASKEKLNLELGWESIMDCGNLSSLNIFHKIHRHESRPLIKSCIPQPDMEKNILFAQKKEMCHKNMKTKHSTNLFS